jgi:CheY-like chemotaxis protein/GGDEF domain-containing protein
MLCILGFSRIVRKLVHTMTKLVNKLLLIEDDLDQLRLSSIIIKRFGFEVVTASDGYSGLDLARHEQPDMIICDMYMPQMSGMAVRNQLTDDPLISNIPFIFLTVQDDHATKIAARARGADDYVIKPFRPDDLIARIRSVLRRHEAGRHQGLIENMMEIERVRRFMYGTRQHVGKAAQCIERMAWSNPLEKYWVLGSRAEIEARFNTMKRSDSAPLVVVCFSLTGWQALDLKCGVHLLTEIVRNLYDAIGGNSLLLRLGTEHFAVLVPHHSTKALALEQAVRGALATSLRTPGSQPPRLQLTSRVASADIPLGDTLCQTESDLFAAIMSDAAVVA